MRELFILFSLCMGFFSSSAQHQLKQLWETKGLATPESVLYDEGRQQLFVSLIDGDGSAKDGQGGIALLALEGALKKIDWITGLDAPKGMALYKGLLYVADIDQVVVIDVAREKVVKRIPIEGSVFLNDVTVDAQGVVYVSDTRAQKIYAVEKGKPTLYLDEVPSVNGLKADGGHLYVAAGPELWKLDAAKNKEVLAAGLALGGDGVEPVGNGDFLVSCWGGLVYYITASGELSLLLDVQGKMNTADLGYNPKTKILYLPTFKANSVVAYQLH